MVKPGRRQKPKLVLMTTYKKLSDLQRVMRHRSQLRELLIIIRKGHIRMRYLDTNGLVSSKHLISSE